MLNDQSLLEICNAVASNSKCLSRKIGAVIVKDGAIIATGYNGPPRKVPHCDVRHQFDDKLWNEIKRNCLFGGKSFEIFQDEAIKKLGIDKLDWNFIRMNNTINECPRQLLGFKSGEGLEWCIAGHAERNALINCAREGISTKGCKMFMNCLISCTPCLVEIINAGISEIIVTEFKYYDKSAEYLVMNSDLIVRNFKGEYLKK